MEGLGYQWFETANYVGFAYPPLPSNFSEGSMVAWAGEQTGKTFIGLGENHGEYSHLNSKVLAIRFGTQGYLNIVENAPAGTNYTGSIMGSTIITVGVEDLELHKKAAIFFAKTKTPKNCENPDEILPFKGYKKLIVRDRNQSFLKTILSFKISRMVFMVGNSHGIDQEAEPFVRNLKNSFDQVLFLFSKSDPSLISLMEESVVTNCVQTLASTLSEKQQTQASIKVLSSYLDTHPLYGNIRLKLIASYARLSRIENKQKNLSYMYKHLEILIRDYPKSLEVNVSYVAYLVEKGQKEDYKKALKVIKNQLTQLETAIKTAQLTKFGVGKYIIASIDQLKKWESLSKQKLAELAEL